MEKKSERPLIRQICILVLLAVCLTACTTIMAGDGQLLIMLDRAGNQMTVNMVDRSAVLDIYSESGLGRAYVQLIAGDYPARILLRLHLRGLEELRVAYAATVITLSIPSTGGFAVHQYHATAGPDSTQPQIITSDSPYWMKTAIVAQTMSAQKSIPLTDGWIEVELPAHFLQGRYTSFSLQWIDFYR